MDPLTRYFTALEDAIERPRHQRIRDALRARAGEVSTLGPLIRRQAERTPDRIALRFEDGETRYGALDEGANRYANLLRARGVTRGDVVNVMMENSPELLMVQIATAKLGAVAALINHHIRGDALAHVQRASGAKWALGDAASTEALAAVAGQLRNLEIHAHPQAISAGEVGAIRDLPDALAGAPPSEPEQAEVSLSDVHLYVYTSGTTGLPRPAIVRHFKPAFGALSLSMQMELEQGDCIYAPTPLYHGWANFVGFYPAMVSGAAFASRRRFSASSFLEDARRHGVTVFAYVGELCRYLMATPPSPADREHRIRLATGAGLRPDIWPAFQRRFGIAKIVDSYGQTEGNISLQNRRGRVGSCGRCDPGMHGQLRLAVYDAERGVLLRGADGFCVEPPPGEPGELLSRIGAKGSVPFDGYADAEENERKLERDCFEPGDVYLRTGDLLRRDLASYYYFVDRIGDTFRWKGENVATLEVEHLINAMEGIRESAVYGVRVPGAEGRAGMALVIPEGDDGFDGDRFYEHVRRVLPEYARPLFVRVGAQMEVTGNFKHRKVGLQGEGFDPARIGDPLYLRDDAVSCYVPLTAEHHAAIESGDLRV